MYHAKNEKVKDAFSSSAETLLHAATFSESGNAKGQAESTNKVNHYSSIV
jgi:hypothetical protein